MIRPPVRLGLTWTVRAWGGDRNSRGVAHPLPDRVCAWHLQLHRRNPEQDARGIGDGARRYVHLTLEQDVTLQVHNDQNVDWPCPRRSPRHRPA